MSLAINFISQDNRIYTIEISSILLKVQKAHTKFYLFLNKFYFQEMPFPKMAWREHAKITTFAYKQNCVYGHNINEKDWFHFTQYTHNTYFGMFLLALFCVLLHSSVNPVAFHMSYWCEDYCVFSLLFSLFFS